MPEHGEGHDMERTHPVKGRQMRAKLESGVWRAGSRPFRLFALIGMLCIPLLIAGKQAGDGGVQQRGAVNEQQKSGEQIPPANQLTVMKGNEFTISLESNPSTGFRWFLAKPLDENRVKLVGSEYKHRPAAGVPRLGAGGVEVWTFRAVGEGTTSILLEYKRSWEKGVAPAKTAVYSIVVR